MLFGVILSSMIYLWLSGLRLETLHSRQEHRLVFSVEFRFFVGVWTYLECISCIIFCFFFLIQALYIYRTWWFLWEIFEGVHTNGFLDLIWWLFDNICSFKPHIATGCLACWLVESSIACTRTFRCKIKSHSYILSNSPFFSFHFCVLKRS